MKLIDFKKLLIAKPIPITTSPKSDLQYVKQLMKEKFDFDCQFNNGKCKNGSNIMCCCEGCYSSIGYLKVIYQEDLHIIAKNYSVKAGFWRKGKGCNLPYRLRSSECVFYNCHSNDETRIALNYIRNTFVREESDLQKFLLNSE